MRTGFRIGDTYEENRYLCTVKLILTTEEDKQWNVLTEHLQQKEISTVISRPTSIVDVKTVASMVVNPRRKRSRSVDEHHFSKRDFRRSN